MFELDIARRHVATNRRGTAFTMISVAIAVGIIIMSLGLTEGVRVQILENTIEKNPHLIINPKKTESYINMYRTLSETMAKYPGVLSVSPRLVGQGAAGFQDRVQGVEFVGVHPLEENQLMAVQGSMISGNFSDLIFSKKGAILGVKLAESLKIRPGGDFYLYFKNIADFTNAPAMALEMNGKSPYKTTSWQDFSKEIARFVGNQNVTNMLFYIFILLISAFVIANTTIMVVSRRKKEIGILMAMGADRSSILKIFLLENMLISVPAGALGCLLGFGLARLISLLPLDVTSTGSKAGVLIVARPEYFVYAMIFALALNLISGIYPAYAAARLDPVEAIASE